MVLLSGEVLPSLKPLQRKGLHLERVNRHSEFSRTLQEAFNQAHFSIIVVRLWGRGGGEEEEGGGSRGRRRERRREEEEGGGRRRREEGGGGGSRGRRRERRREA